MRTVCSRWSFAVVVALVLAVPRVGLAQVAQAAEGQPYVVLVGVGTYKDQAIKPRPHAEADVKALYKLLSDSKYLKCPADHIRLLTTDAGMDRDYPSQLASRDNILEALHWAFRSAGEDDMVLLCWVGQGGPVGDRTCYFANDSSLKNRSRDTIGAGDIQAEVANTKSTKLCILLDVNFHGYEAGDEKVSELGLEKVYDEYEGVKDEEEGPGRPIMLLAANDGLKPSLDGEKNGVFTTLVLEALRGKADIEGGEPDGLVRVDELFNYVRKELPLRANALGKKDQTPMLLRRSTHFVVTHNPAVATEIQDRQDKFEKLVTAGKITGEAVKEGRELLSAMPRRDPQRRLRKIYQQVADGQVTAEELEMQRRNFHKMLEVSRADAEAFADKVLEVTEIVQKHYVKAVKMPELVASAIKGLYRAADEKLPPELADQLSRNKSSDEDVLRNLLMEARQRLGMIDDLQGPKAATAALERMLHGLDPYSNYIDAESMDDFRRATQQDFIGIGITIQKDLGRDLVRVSSPVRDSPAYKAGIQSGDLLVKVTNLVDKKGKPLAEPETISLKGMSTNEVVKTILGPEGTKVILYVERETENGPKELRMELERKRVRVETVIGAKRKSDNKWDYFIDRENKIGYIRLTQFALHTDADLKAAMKSLQKEGLNGLVLDLRFDPGGYLDTAVSICDLFIDDGLIVTQRPREGKPREYKGRHENSLLDFPMVVLINGLSASASEILSACIQDHERGIVMGERSFGKGSVQNIQELSSGDGLKLTTASFWRPSGRNIHRFPNSKETDEWGVMPHPAYTLKLTPTERSELLEHLRQHEAIPRPDAPKKSESESTFTDRQLQMALDYLKKQVAGKTAAKKAG